MIKKILLGLSGSNPDCPLLFRCVHCGKGFAGRKLLEQHLDVHNADKVHRCPICPKRFQSQPSLSQHKATHGQLRLQGWLWRIAICS